MDGFCARLRPICRAGSWKGWLLCELPLWAALALTGALDPADGYAGVRGLTYLPVAALVAGFGMALNWVKGYLLLRFGGVSCGFVESGALLGRIHALRALLEAAATLVLFALRRSGASAVLTQLQLFGHELIYAALLAAWLYLNGKASQRRTIAALLLCFLLSSAWLLLSLFTGMG